MSAGLAWKGFDSASRVGGGTTWWESFDGGNPTGWEILQPPFLPLFLFRPLCFPLFVSRTPHG